MELELGTTSLIPLPEFPSRHGTAAFRRGLCLRRFGTCEADLGIDFAAVNRAALATHLLQLCAVDRESELPDGFFRDLSTGKRIECLLVLAAERADASLNFPFQCGGCAEDLEFDLTLPEICDVQLEADAVEIVSVEVGGRPVDFRKPSGRDQETWFGEVFGDNSSPAAKIIGALVVDPEELGSLRPEDFPIIEDAMEKADPLVNLSCEITCGLCGAANEPEIDLFETALEMLRRAQQRLLMTTHRLALHYHWSEEQIFSVPEWRRQEYLKLIGAKK